MNRFGSVIFVCSELLTAYEFYDPLTVVVYRQLDELEVLAEVADAKPAKAKKAYQKPKKS